MVDAMAVRVRVGAGIGGDEASCSISCAARATPGLLRLDDAYDLLAPASFSGPSQPALLRCSRFSQRSRSSLMRSCGGAP
jgi:hypothetical protein